MLGGLFIANDVQAQVQTSVQVQPVTNWISPQQAIAVATAEVENLTAKVQQMKNNGVGKAELNKVKAELRFYILMLKALQDGMTTEGAFGSAWENSGASADSVKTPYSYQEYKLVYNKTFENFTD
jgi:hypothetical protein